ncbi:hypothetical protein M8845_19140, partial [Gelidibacter japonicus]|uniref:hypothetical protein n=1 Tax=Gelidibacter japonicus TaxID=1962232 RepID=UPI0020210B3A
RCLSHATILTHKRYHTLKRTPMTEVQYQRIVKNQTILDSKLDGIINELKVLKSDVKVAINNQQLLEQYEMEITERLKRIEKK